MDQAVGKQAMVQSASPVSESEKNAIIGGVLLSMLLAALDQTIVAPAMPTIARALGHAEYLPWIVTGYLLTATAVAPLYGKISDVLGRRPTIYAAILIFLAGSLVSALAPNMLVLVVGRAIQGAGGGGLFALAQIVIGDLVPPRERAKYAAWISGTWAVASVAGPLLGGTFAEHLHWSLIFWINLPLGFLAMAIINNPLKKLPIVAKHHRIDGLGAVLLIVATALLLLALNWGGSTYAWISPEILGLVACSAIFWAAFALRLMRAAEPLVSLEVLGNRIVLTGTLSMFLLQAASVGLSVYLPVYLQSIIGLSVSESGTAMLGLLLGTVAGATFSGQAIPRFVHYKRIALIGDRGIPARYSGFSTLVEELAVGLVRDVEMYQWVEHSESKTEKKLGGSEETVTTYNYSKEWRATDVDSNQFRQPDGHSNPQRAVDSARFTVETATVGAFTLPGNRVAALGSEKTIIPGADAIAAFRNAMGGQNVQVHNNLLYVGNDPRGPQVGDLKISYRRIDLAAASFIGAQRGDSLRPYKTSNGRELFLSAAGDSTADEMFESAKTENTVITWIVRAGGLLGMFIGFAFILSILGVAADLIPFVGSIVGFGTSLIAFAATAVLGPVVIAIGWIAYRPLLAIGIVAAGVAVAAGIVALRRRAARPAAPSPTGFGRPTA